MFSYQGARHKSNMHRHSEDTCDFSWTLYARSICEGLFPGKIAATVFSLKNKFKENTVISKGQNCSLGSEFWDLSLEESSRDAKTIFLYHK